MGATPWPPDGWAGSQRVHHIEFMLSIQLLLDVLKNWPAPRTRGVRQSSSSVDKIKQVFLLTRRLSKKRVHDEPSLPRG
jgi:hypothetical protein